jgi:hypothetical protein
MRPENEGTGDGGLEEKPHGKESWRSPFSNAVRNAFRVDRFGKDGNERTRKIVERVNKYASN